MNTVSIVATALATGALAGAEGVGTAAVKDAYEQLKAALKARVKDPAAKVALDKHTEDPDAWLPALKAELLRSGVCGDEDILALAQQVSRAAESAPASFRVKVDNSEAVQIGNGNVMFADLRTRSDLE
ncbi:RIP homotypic interaction motif-containing protein [Pseudonocardia lutea]|uniref:RIP homotypic interaction motif-containing protein n=1 Tax=Pseudonocardia lutea TaxID=2172015 RepID=A0ABW1I5E6_9PSEU